MKNRVSIQYLGGLSVAPPEDTGTLEVTDVDGLLFGWGNPLEWSGTMQIQWSRVDQISIEDASRAKSKIAPVVAFGVFGLAAKGVDEGTALLIEFDHGAEVFIRLKNVIASEVRAFFSSFARFHGFGLVYNGNVAVEKPVDMTPMQMSEPTTQPVSDETLVALERLISFKRQGLFDDVSFIQSVRTALNIE